MTRSKAMEIGKRMSNADIWETLKRARVGIVDWEKASKGNTSMSLGATFNLFVRGLRRYDELGRDMHNLAKRNVVYEFWRFLPEGFYVRPRKRVAPEVTMHESPIEI